MTPSSKCIDLIKRFEGCKLQAYQDSVGVWTIGYGHTENVNRGMSITQEQSDNLLNGDLIPAAVSINLQAPSVNQNQFDALCCFVFNVGVGNFKKSTLLKKLVAGDVTGAADEFLRWNKAGGNVLAGLTARRKAERELFLS